ncbi:hypothetical protein HG531_003505 [Fusarium graminearum]|nr:hypothetical protein HG531_003505 [Fusarium graminearum]
MAVSVGLLDIPLCQLLRQATIHTENYVHGDFALVALDLGNVHLQITNSVETLVVSQHANVLPLVEDDEIRVARLDAGCVTGILVALPVLNIDNTDDTVKDVLSRLARKAVHFKSESRRESRAAGLDNDSVGDDGVFEFLERGAKLANEVTADTSVEKLLNT